MLTNKSLIGRVVFMVALNFLICGVAVAGAEQYNELEDAAVAQARIWQSGGKANPIMSSDGKIIFAYGQSMPKLTCSPTRACDVELQPGEKGKDVVLGDSVNWTWAGAESIENGKTVQHVVFQPHDSDLESNVIIMTDRRTYHIKLYAPKNAGIYLNRVGFYYPQDLVSAWQASDDKAAEIKAKDVKDNIMSRAVSPEKMDFNYKIEGNAAFKPLRVFNDGERVYMEMPDSLKSGENPMLMLLDENGKVMVVNYRREEDPDTGTIHYVVDKLFSQAELRLGPEKVRITAMKKNKSFWGAL